MRAAAHQTSTAFVAQPIRERAQCARLWDWRMRMLYVWHAEPTTMDHVLTRRMSDRAYSIYGAVRAGPASVRLRVRPGSYNQGLKASQ